MKKRAFQNWYVLHLLILILSLQRTIAQGNESKKFVVTHWGMEDGLPQSSVNDIIQSKDGYLWLATFGGLVRFDGSSFTTFNRFNTKGMRSDRILTLYEDHQGALWVGTEDGFLRFQNGECSTFLISEGSQIYSPLQVTEDSRGVIWLSVHGKPYRFSEGTFVQVPVINDTQLADKAVLDHHGVWIAHEREILRTLGDSVVLIADLRSVLKNNIKHVIEYPKKSGTLFLGTTGDGVVRYEQGRCTFYTEKKRPFSKYVWKLYVDRKDLLWSVSFDGLSIWNGSSFDAFNAVSSTEEIQFVSLLEDNEGNYWIGTPSQGFFKVRPSIISTIGEPQGVRNEKMLSLVRLKNGTTLFATNCGGIYEWKNNKATYSAINAYLPNLCNWSVFEDSKKNIWFGSRVLYRTSSLTSPGILFDSASGFTGTDIFAITEDSHNNIWIGCQNGLFIYDGKKFRRYTTRNGLSYNDTRVLFESKNGTMWIGTANGLNAMRYGAIMHVLLRKSATDSLQLHSEYIRAIYEDSEGAMWFGSYGDGLIRLKKGIASFITTQQGLFDNIVSHIIEDKHGNFWMGCNRGIYRVSKKELNEFCDGSIDRVHSFSYGTADGMKSAETNGGFQPSYIQDTVSGTIFFPTVSGVAVVSTNDVHHNVVPPTVKIEKIFSQDKELPFSDEITLPYDSSFLEIHYTALSYIEPKKNRFKYMLEGSDGTWIDAGNRRSAIYSNIPHGDYTFRVVASNNDGVWNTTGASLRIIVLPPFWMTWWFRTLMALLFIASGPTLYYYRITQLKKEKNAQERFAEQLITSQEQERRRIAAELHDGLGQQILVIKNRAELALQEVGDAEKTASQLREIMQSAVSSIGDVRTISHGLRPVHLEQFGLTDAVTILCDQIQRTSTIEWSYHVDDIDGLIPHEKEINFYRIIQEGTNNILKHSGANQASVIIRRVEDGLTTILSDDGKGFDADVRQTTSGMGLSGMNERVKTLGGTIDLQSQIGTGTVLKISIPILKHG